MTEGGSAPPAPDAPPPSLVRKIGGTIYEVTFHFSTTSQETISDKINRLIRRELDASYFFSEFPHSLLDIPSEKPWFCRHRHVR